MAHSLSAKKRVRQNLKARALNRWRLRGMREAIREFLEQILHGTAATATAAMQKAGSVIDRSAQKGVIHRNQAARRKSRMAAKLAAKVKAKA
jgi:small subunit ribosomal protein S20